MLEAQNATEGRVTSALAPGQVREQGDGELVRAALAGGRDRRALAELHRRYARMVHAILLARVPASQADDLVQDVFVDAIARLESLRNGEAFGGWLAQIARNRATDYHRRKKPHVPLDEGTLEQGSEADAQAQAREILAVVRTLPEAYREVLIMRLVEGMTGPEIAERTALTPGSVRVNLHRGMAKLRAALSEVTS